MASRHLFGTARICWEEVTNSDGSASYFVSRLSFEPLLFDYQYEFRVEGTGTGSWGGVYGGMFALGPIVTAPVPEPEIYAMMLAGLGIMGWAARKKKARIAV